MLAFVTGAIVMSFEMLGSRYLGPYFGSGIYTWAALISTVLAALCVGYFLGGALADRRPSPRVLGATVTIGSVYLLLLPAFADATLQFFVAAIDDIALGSLVAALAIMFFPVTLLGMYSPFAIRLLLRSQRNSGVVSGTGHPRSAPSAPGTSSGPEISAHRPPQAAANCRAARCEPRRPRPRLRPRTAPRCAARCRGSRR